MGVNSNSTMKLHIFCKCIFIIVFIATMIVPTFAQETLEENSTVKSDSVETEGNTQDTELVNANEMLRTYPQGIGYGLTVGGATLVSLGVVLEIATLVAFFVLNEDDRLPYITNGGLFSFLHIASAGLITSGTATMLGGATYIDDSRYGRKHWEDTQIVIGSTLLTIGGITTITGAALYGIANKNTNLEIAGAGAIGGGVPLAITGLVSLFIGLFAP